MNDEQLEDALFCSYNRVKGKQPCHLKYNTLLFLYRRSFERLLNSSKKIWLLCIQYLGSHEIHIESEEILPCTQYNVWCRYSSLLILNKIHFRDWKLNSVAHFSPFFVLGRTTKREGNFEGWDMFRHDPLTLKLKVSGEDSYHISIVAFHLDINHWRCDFAFSIINDEYMMPRGRFSSCWEWTHWKVFYTKPGFWISEQWILKNLEGPLREEFPAQEVVQFKIA